MNSSGHYIEKYADFGKSIIREHALCIDSILDSGSLYGDQIFKNQKLICWNLGSNKIHQDL